jgi:glycerate-2-kinase
MLFKNYEEIVSNGATLGLRRKRKDALDVLTAALESVDPYNAVKRVFDGNQIVFESKTFDVSGFENVYVAGFGKASIGMIKAVCDSIDVVNGVVITNDPSARAEVEVFVGSHPIPDVGSIHGTERVIQVVEQIGENDLLILLVSGGGSALLCKPRVDLHDLQLTTDLLLKSGADINEINAVRKHLSFVKGGQLVKQVKGTVVSLIISDIVGDPLESISSGPTCPDPMTFSDAKKVLEKYNLWEKVPLDVRKVVEDGVKGEIAETPKEDDPVFKRVFNFIVANNRIACNAALEKARVLGYEAEILTVSLTGEARYVGRDLVGRVKHRLKTQTLFVSGGETTVTVKGSGKGGRNQELVLGCVEDIAGTDMVIASFATDGIDGKCDAAGAIADGFTLSRARKKGLDPQVFLEENNSYEFFSELDDLFITGLTGTNVTDIQLIIS